MLLSSSMGIKIFCAELIGCTSKQMASPSRSQSNHSTKRSFPRVLSFKFAATTATSCRYNKLRILCLAYSFLSPRCKATVHGDRHVCGCTHPQTCSSTNVFAHTCECLIQILAWLTAMGIAVIICHGNIIQHLRFFTRPHLTAGTSDIASASNGAQGQPSLFTSLLALCQTPAACKGEAHVVHTSNDIHIKQLLRGEASPAFALRGEVVCHQVPTDCCEGDLPNHTIVQCVAELVVGHLTIVAAPYSNIYSHLLLLCSSFEPYNYHRRARLVCREVSNQAFGYLSSDHWLLGDAQDSFGRHTRHVSFYYQVINFSRGLQPDAHGLCKGCPYSTQINTR
jgi:hypothetical protein